MELSYKLTDIGTANLAIALAYSAFYNNDESFFTEDVIGKNVISVIETRTGLTYKKLKDLVEEKKKPKIEYINPDDIKNYTINELAEKYNTTPGKIRYYIRTNNIEFKRIYKKVSYANI